MPPMLPLPIANSSTLAQAVKSSSPHMFWHNSPIMCPKSAPIPVHFFPRPAMAMLQKHRENRGSSHYEMDHHVYFKSTRTEKVINRGRAMSSDHGMCEKRKLSSKEDYPDIDDQQFGERFKLPHITDVLDIPPRPSTFCIQSSCPLPEKGASAGQLDALNKIYVHDDEQVLLKDTLQSLRSPLFETVSQSVKSGHLALNSQVIKYTKPASPGAEPLDNSCKFVQQWVPRAGPRSKIYFDPKEVRAAIVTCGGLCPGLNDVIRQIVMTLEVYGVKHIQGVTYGYRGFFEKTLQEIPLTRHLVQNIHLAGGSLLGISRGGAETSQIVDSLEEKHINMLFVLGGNGTHAGANAIHNECRKRKLKVSVVGVPKTIDNDILLMDRTFGFDTAVEEAQNAINAAYIEANSAYNGIGIVKLMGRQSGFIAMHASLASGQVDVCLIPEVPFRLDGPTGVLHHIQFLVETQGRAVLCVAEGAGQELLIKEEGTDASGNPILADIGVHLTKEVRRHFKEIGVPADVKYIDPTYMIRACRANASDSILCAVLGQNAVHGAFAGYSGITVGLCNNHYALLPILEVIQYTRNVDPNSRMWHRCLTSTGQPNFL